MYPNSGHLRAFFNFFTFVVFYLLLFLPYKAHDVLYTSTISINFYLSSSLASATFRLAVGLRIGAFVFYKLNFLALSMSYTLLAGYFGENPGVLQTPP